jgi:predicted Zn-dependent protease
VSAAAEFLKGSYQDGQVALGSPATMIVAPREVALIGERISQRYEPQRLRVSPRVGDSERFVALPDGGQFQCPDHPALDRLPQEVRSEGPVAWLERRWPVAAACVVLVASLAGAGYFYGLPAAAERVAAEIPIETERALGEEALTWLDTQSWFDPTELDEETQARLLEGFERLASGLPLEPHYRLAFRDAEFFGPNALALPGGTIVVTDQLVHLAQSDEEVLAVLAHEMGHVEMRHAMRHVLHDSATAVVVATLTADAASLGTAVAGLPALLAQLEYSREFETEADDYAFRLLRRKGISPEAFAAIMERLQGERGGGDDDNELAFLSTHPVTAERIARARAAASEPSLPGPEGEPKP